MARKKRIVALTNRNHDRTLDYNEFVNMMDGETWIRIYRAENEPQPSHWFFDLKYERLQAEINSLTNLLEVQLTDVAGDEALGHLEAWVKRIPELDITTTTTICTIGDTGTGKSSLVSALLDIQHITPSGISELITRAPMMFYANKNSKININAEITLLTTTQREKNAAHAEEMVNLWLRDTRYQVRDLCEIDRQHTNNMIESPEREWNFRFVRDLLERVFTISTSNSNEAAKAVKDLCTTYNQNKVKTIMLAILNHLIEDLEKNHPGSLKFGSGTVEQHAIRMGEWLGASSKQCLVNMIKVEINDNALLSTGLRIIDLPGK